MESKWRYAGVISVLGASLGAAVALLIGQIDRSLAVGIAMVGILIGSAIARGSFRDTQPAAPAGAQPAGNEQRPISGKE